MSFHLNPSQLSAVNYQGQHLLILAGPGTGKTHTLTHAIAQTVSKLGAKERVLAITFTNKAADEMHTRLQKMPVSNQQIFIGTFHSFCLDILRQFTKEANLPADFKILSPEEIESALKNFWPDKKKSQIDDILKDVSRFKSILHDGTTPVMVSQYNKFLRTRGWLDYDDLLVEALKLLKANPSIRQQIQKTYPFIFVDEYQDINGVQHALLTSLVGKQAHLTAIGDPNQAIYGFRGSDVGFFKSFENDFPNAQTLSLSQNYRSTPNLLKASAQVIEKSTFKVPALTAAIYREGRLVIHECLTDKAEAEYVVHQIERLVGGTSMFSQDSGRVERHSESSYSFADFAVLYRLNALRPALEEALLRSGIPFQFSGDKMHPVDNALDKNIERVSLSTLHAAKGLEFGVVFIVGCEENILPLYLAGLDTNEEEERRLFYVGMTRAKEVLYLTRSRKRRLFGKLLEARASRFLSDIEDQLKEYEKIVTAPKRQKEGRQIELFG